MKRVLVVDDTKNIRMILTKCLELEGYNVLTASDGRQALEMLTSQPFDLAFIDIKLPEIRGTEVLKRIRELGVKTPVIIITAYATVKNAVDCTNMGAVAYVQKPFSAEKIKSVLKSMEINPANSGREDNSAAKWIDDARSYLASGVYDKVLELSRKALSIELDNPEIYLLISKAYEGMEKLDDAVRFYQFYQSFNRSQI